MSTLNVNNVNEVGGASVIASGVLDSGSLPTGTILQVVSTTKTDTFSASVAGSGSVAVTGLSITHSLSNSSNKLVLMATFGAAGSSQNTARVGLNIHDGTSFIVEPTTPSARTAVLAGGWQNSTAVTNMTQNVSAQVEYSPGTTSSITYTVHVINVDSTTQTLYVNRSGGDGDNGNNVRAVSSLVLLEIAG